MTPEEARAYLMQFGTYGGMLIVNLTLGMTVPEVKAEIKRLSTGLPEAIAAKNALSQALPYTVLRRPKKAPRARK